MTGEKEKDGIERVSADRTDFFLGYFSECKRRAALEVDVIRKGECGQRGEWKGIRDVIGYPVRKEYALSRY